MHMTAQMKPNACNFLSSIYNIGFLKNVKLACSTNEVHEGADVWLFHLFLNNTASVVLNTRLSAACTDAKSSRPTSSKSRYFTTYAQVIYFLLKKYATDEAISETVAGTTRF